MNKKHVLFLVLFSSLTFGCNDHKIEYKPCEMIFVENTEMTLTETQQVSYIAKYNAKVETRPSIANKNGFYYSESDQSISLYVDVITDIDKDPVFPAFVTYRSGTENTTFTLSKTYSCKLRDEVNIFYCEETKKGYVEEFRCYSDATDSITTSLFEELKDKFIFPILSSDVQIYTYIDTAIKFESYFKKINFEIGDSLVVYTYKEN